MTLTTKSVSRPITTWIITYDSVIIRYNKLLGCIIMHHNFDKVLINILANFWSDSPNNYLISIIIYSNYQMIFDNEKSWDNGW